MNDEINHFKFIRKIYNLILHETAYAEFMEWIFKRLNSISLTRLY